MGKRIKKGKEGPSKDYISRAKAIKKLQLNLKDFRKMCILKGIYPRVGPKKLSKTRMSYYHQKDINYLMNEKILHKIREQKSHAKKVRKALARGENLRASILKKNKPKYDLDHLVRERYPTFSDALKDMDDALSLVSLFSKLPANKELGIDRGVVQKCTEIIDAFHLYTVLSKSLTKSFLSIKGIYFQNHIYDIPITWIEPYDLNPQLPLDVDYKVMLTFLEFYLTFLKHTIYKLFRNVNIDYQFKNFNMMELYKKYSKNFDLNEEIPTEFENDEHIKKIRDDIQKQQQRTHLFKDLLFYISSECPRTPLILLILSAGGRVCWDGDDQDTDFENPAISFVITDRPLQSVKIVKNREYVQPQWVFDSLNQQKILQVSLYGPGKILPPHLSPFVADPEIKDGKTLDSDMVELQKSMMAKSQRKLYDMVKQKQDQVQQKIKKREEKKQKKVVATNNE